MPDNNRLDDPVVRARAVRNLLLLAPVSFVFTYWLAWIQGGRPQDCLLIGIIGLAMALGAALVIHLMGSRSRTVLTIVQVILALAVRRR